MASWPTSVKSFTRVVNGVTKLVAALYNSAYDEIEAIQTNLSGSVVQVVNTQTGAVATGTTIILKDDTIPQNTEGDEYMTLAITPKSATNKLKIEVIFFGSHDTAGSGQIIMALFQDATADALAATNILADGNSGILSIKYYMTAGTTSATTFKVRAGGLAGTLTFNGISGGRLFGGVASSSITITEIRV